MTMNLAHVDPVSVARFDQTYAQTKNESRYQDLTIPIETAEIATWNRYIIYGVKIYTSF